MKLEFGFILLACVNNPFCPTEIGDFLARKLT